MEPGRSKLRLRGEGGTAKLAGSMPVLVRYVLLQLPGWTLASVVLWFAWSVWGLPPSFAVAGLVLWIAKDFALYPFVRDAYVVSASRWVGPETLVGSEGIADERLAPSGHVHLRGERWRAEATRPVERGDRVRVLAVRGLTVEVEPLDDSDAS